MSGSERIHFVHGDLSGELDRLDATRTETCVDCEVEVTDQEVGLLDWNGEEYDTVCIWCKDSHADVED